MIARKVSMPAYDPQRTCANTSTASDLRALLCMPFERVPREFLITPARALFSPVLYPIPD